MQSLAFDLEIVKELPDGQDWEPYRPFGVSIISTCTETWIFRTWPTADSIHKDGAERKYPAQLGAWGSVPAAHYLLDCAAADIPIITLNGLGFDFRVLVEELADLNDKALQHAIAQLAYSDMHIDIGFAMICELGFMCGMQAACKGMGLPGKSDGMTGKLIPTMWQGTLAEQELCLDYCRNDVAMTSLVWQGMLYHEALRYEDKQGHLHVWRPRDMTKLDVIHAQEAPEVGRPFWKRSKFTSWLEQYL